MNSMRAASLCGTLSLSLSLSLSLLPYAASASTKLIRVNEAWCAGPGSGWCNCSSSPAFADSLANALDPSCREDGDRIQWECDDPAGCVHLLNQVFDFPSTGPLGNELIIDPPRSITMKNSFGHSPRSMILFPPGAARWSVEGLVVDGNEDLVGKRRE
jgi:hypothetical protein